MAAAHEVAHVIVGQARGIATMNPRIWRNPSYVPGEMDQAWIGAV